jgi:hypothetical protein
MKRIPKTKRRQLESGDQGVARAWIELQRNWWAFDEVRSAVEKQPRRAWRLLVHLPPLDPNVIESVAIEAGIRPEIAFAMAKTGVFLMKENEHLYSDEDKEDFWAAVEEYRERAARQDA